MRLAYCYHCQTLSKLDDYTGSVPENDVLLQDWIDRHMHGLSVETHPGGRIFPVSIEQYGIEESEAMDAIERKAVEEVRSELAKVNMEVFAYRDELKEDAAKCHRRHGQPSWPGKPCPDYRDDSKRVGRKIHLKNDFAKFLCTYCSYESTVTVAKRERKGMYG